MNTYLQRLISGEREAILLAAAGYFALMGLLCLFHMFRLSRWPTVTGVLHEEKVERSDLGAISPDEREYEAAVRYSYCVDGVDYENDQLNPWAVMATHNLRALLKLQFRGIERQAGERVTVYYHPRKPQKSYLTVPGWRSIVLVVGACSGAVLVLLSAM